MRKLVEFAWQLFCSISWYVFAVVVTYTIGRLSPMTYLRGVKVLAYAPETKTPGSPVALRYGRLSTMWGDGSIYIRFRLDAPRWQDDDCLRLTEVAWADRDVTWCFGWEGASADAFRAACVMR